MTNVKKKNILNKLLTFCFRSLWCLNLKKKKRKGLYSREAARMCKAYKMWQQTPPTGGHIVLQDAYDTSVRFFLKSP